MLSDIVGGICVGVWLAASIGSGAVVPNVLASTKRHKYCLSGAVVAAPVMLVTVGALLTERFTGGGLPFAALVVAYTLAFQVVGVLLGIPWIT